MFSRVGVYDRITIDIFSTGLCCAALLAKYGYSVTVCEAHYHAGGAAHAFDVGGYSFDSGPSFFAGLSGPKGNSTNPLKQVLDAVDEKVECVTYDRVRSDLHWYSLSSLLCCSLLHLSAALSVNVSLTHFPLNDAVDYICTSS